MSSDNTGFFGGHASTHSVVPTNTVWVAYKDVNSLTSSHLLSQILTSIGPKLVSSNTLTTIASYTITMAHLGWTVTSIGVFVYIFLVWNRQRNLLKKAVPIPPKPAGNDTT